MHRTKKKLTKRRDFLNVEILPYMILSTLMDRYAKNGRAQRRCFSAILKNHEEGLKEPPPPPPGRGLTKERTLQSQSGSLYAGAQLTLLTLPVFGHRQGHME